jgi:hypothetical protein
MLPLRIDVGLDGAPPVERWTSVEAVEPGEDELVYELSYADGGPRIQRVAAPWFGQARPDHEHTRVLVLGTWTLLLYGVVALQVLRWRS